MAQETWEIELQDADTAAATRAAGALADRLREVPGVESAERSKGRDDTMDLGAIITVVAGTAAATALAQGIAAWLRARRGVRLRITRADGSVVELDGVDPETGLKALRHSDRP